MIGIYLATRSTGTPVDEETVAMSISSFGVSVMIPGIPDFINRSPPIPSEFHPPGV